MRCCINSQLNMQIMKQYTVLLSAIILLIASGCATTKDVAYLQYAEKQMKTEARTLQEATIKPKDILTVNIQASKPELVASFNGIYWTPQQQYSSMQSGMRTFLVDNSGEVDLPVLGLTKLGGLSLREAEEVVKKALTAYLNEVPSVNVQIQNYRYSVLGEVHKPGAFVSANGKVTLFEALANAGDLTIYGIRDRVKILRENSDGSTTIATINLTDPEIINSPYYYLQQGDVLYVMPNNAIASSSNISSGTTVWISISSIALTVANLLITILRR
ncbi:polysaccharide export protein Wza [Chlamydia trachomatis]|nr:polysaccharide export protein Wza [Chlamydia trachomatis]